MRTRFWLLVSSVLVLALVASPLPGFLASSADAVTAGDLSVPYGSSGWKYKVVAHGAEPGFESPSVDDSAWSIGTAPFGNQGCSGMPAPVTSWPVNTDLLVRRTISLNPATVETDPVLKVAIDNDVDVFFNGVLIASNDYEGCGAEKARFDIPRSLLRSGANTLAVRAIDRGQIDYLDLDLSLTGGGDPEPPVTGHDPVANAGPDQAVTEGSVVSLDGSGSQASTKPVLSASEKVGSLPGGTSLGVHVVGLDPDAETPRLSGSVDLGQGPAVTNTSVAYVVDISGSTNDIVNCGGNINGDGRTGTVLDCEIAAVLALHEKVVASGTVDKVGLIALNSGASAKDLDPTSGVATLIAPDADKDNNGVLDLVTAAKALRVSGGTAFAPAVRTACSLLATSGSPNLVSAFMSDGEANDALPPLPCDPPVTFQTFAVGAGSSCTYGSAGRGLDDIAIKTGGTCLNVPDVQNLPDILPAVIGSELTKVTYTLDDGPAVDLSAELGLPKAGPTDVGLDVPLPTDLTPGTHRICVTATGTDSGGESTVTTCSDLVFVTGEISYLWRLVSADGPPAVLTARTSPRPSFVATDDGEYVFELTVTDGLGSSATDQVRVSVANADPTLAIEPGAAFAGGVTQINGSFNDPGWVDTHTATFAWGDGTTQAVDVSVQGSGWGTFFGSHVYQNAGTYHVEVTLRDDDGGTVTKVVDQLRVQAPVAVWANSTSLTKSLNWGGAEGNIWGRVHTNGLLRFVGATKSVIGPSTYAGSISADTTKYSFVPLPVQAPVQDFPVRYDLADYRPGGPVAHEIGAAYHDMTSSCSAGSWHEVQTVLASGVYYADCPIMLNGSDIGGRVTLVSTGAIKISGSRPAFEPYLDGLLLLAGSSSTKAIDVATSSSKFLGVIFAGTGEVSISGSGNRFFCGVLGDRIDITGGDTDIRGGNCGRPDNTVSGPVLVPDLTASLNVDKDAVLPSQRLGYDLTLTNSGATLVAPALVGLQNVDSVTETVGGYDFALERLDTASGTWVPLATKGDDGFRIDLRPNAFPGVAYPADGGVAGTTMPAGGWATWGLQAVLSLTPSQARDLLDPAKTAGIRTHVDFTVSPSGAQARRLVTFGDNFIEALRALSADVTDVRPTLLVPSGDAEAIGPDTEPGLQALAPGASITVHRDWDVPTPARRGAGESDDGYLARLRALDGTPLTAGSFVLASGGVGRLVAPLSVVTSHRQLPVVKVSTSGPATITAGTTADYEIGLTNVGSQPGGDLEVAATAAGAPLSVTGAPTGLAAGELGSATTTYHANATPAGGTVPVRGTATWTDAAGNTYGATGSTVAVTEQAPAKLQATLAEMLVVDVGGDGAASPGDTLRYTMVVRNTGDVPLAGVTATAPLDANTSYVAGSGVLANGTVDHAGGVVHATFPDVLGQTARTLTFDVTIADPFPGGVTRVQTQGTVTATGQPDTLTDDVTEPGPADPTSTPVIRSYADLAALLSGRLVVDADGDGTVTPGDTLAYDLDVASVGTRDVTGVHTTVLIPAGTTLVDGSISTTQGTLGNQIQVDLGALGPFQQATVRFRLKVDQPLAADITAVSAQAQVTSDQLPAFSSDDPSTAEVGDPTVLPVGMAPGTPDRTGPVVSGLAPADGVIATEPVHVTATLTAPDGQTLDSWVVDYRRADDTTTTVLASGTGGVVDAVLDPTVLPNGTYVVTVRGTTVSGGLTTQEITVVVDGEMKLGRYRTTLTDLTVGVAGLPIQVQRTYDSFDKAKGDFGVGWTMGLANFQVSSNGPLGQGPWTMQSCGGGLIFSTLCFSSDQPHFVTVTWPDGHNEYFDLTPAKGSTFFSGLTSAEFTARRGTTSKLRATDTSLFWVNGNLNGGLFGSDGLYDPTSFVLTDKFGTKYSLQVGLGLTKIEDQGGNLTTFSRNGITSSQGPSVTFTRDAQDRVTKVTGPDGKAVSYGYDATGDLVSVTNQLGKTTTMSYLAGHYLDQVTGPDSAVMARFEYTDGRITAVIDGEGNRTEIGSSVGDRQETVTDPGGKRTTIRSYDDRGLLVRINEVYGGLAHVTDYGYDDSRNLVYRKDPAGHEWRATYTNGAITSITLPSGARASATYNAASQPLTWTDAGGATTTYTWNANGTLASVTDALGHVESYTNNASGLRTGKTDRNGKAWAWTYTSTGLLESETDPDGNVTRYEYDAAGRLTATVDPLGHRTTTEYDAAGHRLSETDADGRQRRWEYDALGQVVRMVRPGGAAIDYAYDSAGRRTGIDNHVDATTVYGYDPMGRVTSVKFGALTATTTAYDGGGDVVSETDALGRATSYSYYLNRQLHTETNPAGGTTTYTYTADGELASKQDAHGGTTSYVHLPSGAISTVTDPAGVVTENQYDALGRLRFTVFEDGTKVEQRYDAAGNLVRSIDQDGDATVFEYNGAGRQTAQVDPEGRRTETTYDKAGRPTRVTRPDGGAAVTSYSPGGQILGVTTPEGVATTYEYDARGFRTRMVDALGHVWSTSYDDLGRVLTERDPRQQGTGPATTSNVYDDYGRLVSTTDALGDKVAFGYDDAGQRTRVTDPRGKTWQVQYGDLGSVTQERDPLGRSHVLTYDQAGLLTSATDARGVTVDYAYRPDGQLAGLSERGGAGTGAYGYDVLGRMSTMTDATGVTTWGYTPDSQVASVNSPAGTVSYGYDHSGLRTSLTQPAGTVTSTYDASGRLSATTDLDGNTTTSHFDKDGRIASLTRSNGVSTQWSYDAAGRLTGLQHLKGGTVVDGAEYGLDADGNRISLRTQAGLETYTLNAIDQLTSVTYPGGGTTSYTYDAAGNRLTAKTGTAAAVQSVYDDAGQLVTVDGQPVQHDANGNVTQDANGAYSWDWLNRMTKVESGGTSVEYAYDGDDNRVAVTAGSDTDELLVDRYAADGVPRLVADGESSYVYGPGGVLSESGSSTNYPLADAAGSIRSVTDANGAVIGRKTYDVFGAVRSSTGSSGALGFGGAPQSGDIVHLNARDLSTSSGRFLSVDPVRPGAAGVVGWNQYTYVANNPTTWTDPSGATALEYGITLRPAMIIIPALIYLAFVIGQKFTDATVHVGLGAPSIFNGPSSDPDPDDDLEPNPKPIPIPLPLPDPDGDDDDHRACAPGSQGSSWYEYATPQPVYVDGVLKERAVGARACIKNPIVRDGGSRYTPDGWVEGMHRGHLIANVLGGSNSNPGNFVPLYPYANTPVMRAFELRAAALVGSGETLYYRSIPGWRGANDLIPYAVSIAYNGDRGSADAVSILNIR